MILTVEMFLAILKELRCLRCVDGNILILDIMDCSITVSLLHPSPNLELYTLPGKKTYVAPENGWLKDYSFLLGWHLFFRVLC